MSEQLAIEVDLEAGFEFVAEFAFATDFEADCAP